jgi:hypothetical protein
MLCDGVIFCALWDSLTMVSDATAEDGVSLYYNIRIMDINNTSPLGCNLRVNCGLCYTMGHT